MNCNDVICKILIGGLLGLIGQGIRVIVGLKKLGEKKAENKRNADNAAIVNAANAAVAVANAANAQNAAAGNAPANAADVVTPGTIPGSDYSGMRFGMSLFTGFIAGALGGLFAVDLKDPIENKTLVTLISFGYAGTDFIEGLVSKLGIGSNTDKS
jgi:hypothetical protein